MCKLFEYLAQPLVISTPGVGYQCCALWAYAVVVESLIKNLEGRWN